MPTKQGTNTKKNGMYLKLENLTKVEKYFPDFLKFFGTEIISSILVGLAGGIVALRFEKEKITIFRSISTIFAGIVGAVYLGNGVCEWLNIDGKTCDALKFMIALSAMRIFEGILAGVDYFKTNPLKVAKVLLSKEIDIKESKENVSNDTKDLAKTDPN